MTSVMKVLDHIMTEHDLDKNEINVLLNVAHILRTVENLCFSAEWANKDADYMTWQPGETAKG